MKIVATSNFDLETFSEYFIAENVPSWWGQKIVQLLQDHMNENDSVFPRLVNDDYKLYKWEP